MKYFFFMIALMVWQAIMATHGVYRHNDNPRRKRSQLQGVNCYDDSNRGIHYSGIVNVTKWGIGCKPWMEYQLRNAKQHRNYCRNPTGKLDGPWCYIDENYQNWQYCDIPSCQSMLKCCYDDKYHLNGHNIFINV